MKEDYPQAVKNELQMHEQHGYKLLGEPKQCPRHSEDDDFYFSFAFARHDKNIPDIVWVQFVNLWLEPNGKVFMRQHMDHSLGKLKEVAMLADEYAQKTLFEGANA